jgi:REP element-mobilizing transposase RayT
MLRVARIVVPGVPHHVTQRGNNRQEVFFVDDDRRFYLELLARQAQTFLSKTERMLGRRLRPLPVGRPHKRQDDEGNR